MKRAALIYNAEAGSSRQDSPEDLVLALHAVGYEAQYRPTQNEQDLDAALRDLPEIVFVAGGDGTLRGVATRLAGRSGVLLGILPLGTSNNIGHTLGLNLRLPDLIAAYARTQVRPFDVGRIAAPWGEDLFIEACGCGLFADVLAAYDPDAPKSPVRAVQAVVGTLPSFQPLALALQLDGQAQPEQPLALLEVMNIKATGNSMRIAPSADPSDGLLDVVEVNAAERDSVLAYVSALARDTFEYLPSVQTLQAKTVEIPYTGQAFHVDGEVRPAQAGVRGVVKLSVWPAALHLLLPAATGPAQ